MLLCCAVLAVAHAAFADEPVRIGSRRQLFVDRTLIDKLDNAQLRLNEPRPAGTAVQFDLAHEGVFSAYVTVLKDADTYRMYYRGLAGLRNGVADHQHGEVTCYAESRDGITWTKPSLGLVEVNGSRDNNIILAHNAMCHNFAPFIDMRPGVPMSQRLKALGGSQKTGLLAYVSSDGIHWKPLRKEPLITKGAFDSQNVAFWSENEERYVCYFRTFKKVGGEDYRWISRTTSEDFLTWTEPVEMSFGDAAPEHLYTNQTQAYFRADGIYIGLAARFMPGRRVVSNETARELGVVGDYAGDCSDAVLLTSRGGDRYDRTFPEAFIRPGFGEANWTSRTNYPACGVVPTGPAEISLYVQRHYAQPSHHLERLTLRTDGFASVRAPLAGGELVTRPLQFKGRRLAINYATSAAGSLRVEIQDADGRPLDGCTLADSAEIIGDEINRVVTWKAGPDVRKLSAQPVRLRFAMKDADLYSFYFQNSF